LLAFHKPTPERAPVPGEQLVGQFQGVIAAGAGAQDDRQQLGQREGLGAEVLQPLAWALVGGHFAHGRVVVQFRASVRVGVRFEGEHAVVFLLRIVMGLSPPIPKVAGKRGNGICFLAAAVCGEEVKTAFTLPRTARKALRRRFITME
jgi:hypothetical protein